MASSVAGMTEDNLELRDIAAVVVHHRSYDSVPVTVRSLLSEGIPARRVVVVDNSEQEHRQSGLRRTLPDDVELLHVPNRGYGAAVNVGLDFLQSHVGEDATYVLVTSHEARPQKGTVARLRRALDEDPSAAAAGPTLVTGHGAGQRTWSQGGYLTRLLHRPMHHGHRGEHTAVEHADPEPRQWLDGAFVLYRRTDLSAHRFSEDYFLYMEETDLHLRLGRAGRGVLWVPDAVAWQSSNGVPAYFFARNLRLLYARNDASWRRRYGARILAARRLAGGLRRGIGASTEAAELLRGTRVPLPSSGERIEQDLLVVVNPLGTALRHYESELLSAVRSPDAPLIALTTSEPSASGRGRASWLIAHLALLARAAILTRRGSRGRVLVTWPVLGYWDLVLVRMAAGRRGSLVLHDPVPLVQAVGYGRAARRVGRLLGAGVQVILHSQAARDALDPGLPAQLVTVVPHPMLPPRTERAERSRTDGITVVRVLGQYKPDRDVAALRRVAEQLAASARLEVHGRGWPEIEGWSVQSAFVTEAQLDEHIASSDVVLIPYQRFFQSGIAIRCLEQGIPVVGPAGSSLDELYGHDSPLLVHDGDDWPRAVAAAVDRGRGEAEKAAWVRHAAVTQAWHEWRQH